MKTRRFRDFGAAMILLLVATDGLWGDTTVGGLVTADTHWTAPNSPYVVTESLLVSNNATLLIDPGVEVRLDPSVRLEVGVGTLIARGTEAFPIQFTANVSGTPTDSQRWDRIEFGDGSVDAAFDAAGNYISGSVIEYAVVEYAGDSGRQVRGAIHVAESSPCIAHSVIQHNLRGGIGADNADGLRVLANCITDNTAWTEFVVSGGSAYYRAKGAGVYLADSEDVTLADNEVSGNWNRTAHGFEGYFYGAVYMHSCEQVTVLRNTIRDNQGTIEFPVDGGSIFAGHGGVYLDSSSDVHLVESRVLENSGHGIFAEDCDQLAFGDGTSAPTWVVTFHPPATNTSRKNR